MKRLTLAIVFTCVLSVSAFAGETQTPPGETHSPPSEAQIMAGETSNPSGETDTPPEDLQTPLSILAMVILTMITWRR
jgi:hypothetical protein